MELNNTIATPLYKQLEKKLQQEIDSGKRPAGSRIPTENELSKTYNVSRVTVRKALSELSASGYLERKSGKGTFVAEKKLQRGITNGVLGFSEMCKMMDAIPGAKIIKIALEEPSEKDIQQMSLAEDEKILVLERVRYADGKPVLLELNKFPESFSFLFGENLTDTSLYEILEKHNIILDHSRKTLDIVFADTKEAKTLGISRGYPLLRINSVIHNADNTVTNLCQQLCIGDKFTFII
ncbi:GntR family transcriptional regulator [Clostridium sp. C8-1-8]|uniref:GntR family transcriptional regulator n=1 Tax=Clostridium sp. C8-1-8 TaxID=2698831 RepID=UPI00136892E1|nr:GntR family transcriptional regulator [Clostridium sp. C8-1-8]